MLKQYLYAYMLFRCTLPDPLYTVDNIPIIFQILNLTQVKGLSNENIHIFSLVQVQNKKV